MGYMGIWEDVVADFNEMIVKMPWKVEIAVELSTGLYAYRHRCGLVTHCLDIILANDASLIEGSAHARDVVYCHHA